MSPRRQSSTTTLLPPEPGFSGTRRSIVGACLPRRLARSYSSALSLALYRLFEDVDRRRAQQLVALVLVSSALGLVTVVFSAAALLVFRGGDAFAGFDGHTREAVGMLLIRMHGQANGINQMFWGLWLLPFGWVVVRSRFLPRWLGYWLLLDGIAWVVLSMTWFLAPDHTDALFRYFQPVFMAELAAMLWLLIMGAKEQPLIAPANT